MGRHIPLGGWFRVLPSAVSGCSVSSVHIRQHLSSFCTWGNRWCALPVIMYVVIEDGSIDRGLSPVGTLGPLPKWGRHHHLLRRIDYITFSMGMDSISDMSHMVVISAIALSLGGSMRRNGGRTFLWI